VAAEKYPKPKSIVMATYLGQLELFPLPTSRRAIYQLQLPLIGGRFNGFFPEEKLAE
jgi:hypothetical protein